MKSKDPIEKEETADYSLPFAKPYLHTKDGGPINAADTRAGPRCGNEMSGAMDSALPLW